MRVTGLEQQKKNIVAVSLDGVPALTVAVEVAAGHALRVGMELAPEEVLKLNRADDLYRAHKAALRYLGYRLRAEKEMRDRLRRNGFRPDVIESEMRRLKDLLLIDDAAFAQFWKDGREASRPQSRRVMRLELQRKGVDKEVIVEVVQDVDEEEGAYRVAQKKVRSLSGLAEKEFYRRLGQFLQRRGYGYELSRRVVERLWRERTA